MLKNMKCLFKSLVQSSVNINTHLKKVCLISMSQFGGPLQQDPHRKANCILIASKQILFLGCKLHKICVGWCLDHSIIDS